MSFLKIALISLSFATLSWAGPSIYNLDVSHSGIGFQVTHMMISKVNGSFGDFKMNVKWDEKDLAASSLTANIQVKSITTANTKRDKHLRSPDFFDAEKYPTITFISKSIVKKGKGYVAKGTLNMHGVSREIELPFQVLGIITDPWGNVRLGLEGEITLNRNDYGVTWNKVMDQGGIVVSEEVKISVTFEGILQK